MLGKERVYPVSKESLLTRLRENRAVHVSEYTAAMIEYRKALVLALIDQIHERNEAIARARDGIEPMLDFSDKLPRQPTSYAQTYNRAIGLLEMTTLGEIEITGDDYRRFVDDEWEWSEDFKNVAMSYTSPRRGLRAE